MSNGTLASFLFGESKLNWHCRKQIALGIARGLLYLHEDCSSQIIHCDIKPENVLLDDTFTARIAEFGLAKLLRTDQTRTITAIRGTRGYVAPEWFKALPITVKVDVYSYGILLLEIICCRKNFEAEATNENEMILADWAYDCYNQRKLHLLLDSDEEAMDDMRKMEKCVMTALWCIQQDPSLMMFGSKVRDLNKFLEQTYESAEKCLKTNYYGIKQMSKALIRLLQKSDSPKMVNVSSNIGRLKLLTHQKARDELGDVEGLTEEKVDKVVEEFLTDAKENLVETNGWPINFSAYNVSKAALNAYTRVLAKNHPNIAINAVGPGYTSTDLNFNLGGHSVEEGAKGPVKLALSPEGGPSGLYFDQLEVSSF
ncbi:G-type lectin S-receptor-like serine/threonine-protein kinase LECRK2 [Rosa rugosa]|uniref:G-type lectin S-receptor-like serine/threonine-protein kinase LECRK2 n=1 Tax=Rosa rugosa TaxID=74645 RepID=UPI002B40DAE2|nr:G-type lectin S-receptor-like serine/threonine-protein kinase LECRK2 [Rosa rugosa]